MRRIALMIAVCAVAVGAVIVAVIQPGAASHGGTWSAPATLARCSGPGTPHVVFGADSPFHGVGDGAIVFNTRSGCRSGGPGPRVAAIASDEVSTPPEQPRTASGRSVQLTRLTAAAATSHGQIVLVGQASSKVHPNPAALLSEGPAEGPFTVATPLGGGRAPLALTTAYLGDVAIAFSRERSLPAEGLGDGVQLRMQRYFASRFASAGAIVGHGGAQRALSLALDYRTDALAVWWRAGYLYARERHGRGTLAPLQRIARASSHVEIAAVISDDGRAILAWMDRHPHTAELYLDISGPDMRLGRPRLLERLRFPRAPPPPDGSLRLVRLSTEKVLMAWTGTDHEGYVVRAAGIDLDGIRAESTISTHGAGAVLLALATGPRGDAVALWRDRRPPTAGGATGPQTLFAARGVPSTRGALRFGPPEQLAPPGRYSGADLAIDPDSDRAIASWREHDGRILYAVRAQP
jgi:hypothetical protein